jgi:hypothetical protein
VVVEGVCEAVPGDLARLVFGEGVEPVPPLSAAEAATRREEDKAR